MAHKTSKDIGLRIDTAGGALSDISGSVNSASLRQACTILDDTGMGDTTHTTLPGLVQAPVIPLNGWVNSTTDSIFGADIANAATNTVEFKVYTGRYYYGEMYVQDYEVSGGVDTLQTWSANLIAENGLTRTSVAQA